MNKENIKIVRDHLASIDDSRFDMRDLLIRDGVPDCIDDYDDGPAKLLRGCGTAACIAGWTNFIFSPKTKGAHTTHAAETLGLDGSQCFALFLPLGFGTPGKYTREQAIRVLDHLLETEEINWNI